MMSFEQNGSPLTRKIVSVTRTTPPPFDRVGVLEVDASGPAANRRRRYADRIFAPALRLGMLSG